MTGVWAVVPAKPLAFGKSRLAGILSARARRALNERLLRHVLGTVIAVVGARRTIVVSRDIAVLGIARQAGAHACREGGARDLNRALDRGAGFAAERGARAVLIVFSDLPRLAAEELRLLIGSAGRPPSVVAATDRAGSGTNALLVSPPGAMSFGFGLRSLQRHRRTARRAGCRWQVVRAPGLAFDVDRPADYRALIG